MADNTTPKTGSTHPGKNIQIDPNDPRKLLENDQDASRANQNEQELNEHQKKQGRKDGVERVEQTGDDKQPR